MVKKTAAQDNSRCTKCNNSYGRYGKSPDGVRLGPWIPCNACRSNR